MGRFDALTRLNEEKETTAPAKPAYSPASNSTDTATPIDEDGKTSLLANSQTSKSVNQQTSKLANFQISKEASEQTSKLANFQISKEASEQTRKPTNLQTSKSSLSTKEKKKYGTYLRPDSILAIKMQSIQEGKKDHELLQEIIDLYYQTSKK
jgi:hypothetical protein